MGGALSRSRAGMRGGTLAGMQRDSVLEARRRGWDVGHQGRNPRRLRQLEHGRLAGEIHLRCLMSACTLHPLAWRLPLEGSSSQHVAATDLPAIPQSVPELMSGLANPACVVAPVEASRPGIGRSVTQPFGTQRHYCGRPCVPQNCPEINRRKTRRP